MEEDIENRVPPTGRAEGQDGKVKGQEHQHLEQKDQRRRMEEKGEEINKAAGAGTGKKSSRLGSLWSIFMHADATDGVLMVLGFLGALGDGLGTPVMLLISSKIMNSLGDSSSALSGGGSAAGFTHDINKNALYLVYLACGTAVSCFLEGYCWTRTGDRQASRMRARYLRAVLRQDVEYFELQSDSTSQVVTSVSSDSLVIQEALADKVPNFIMNATTFFGSYIAAFILTWRLALVATPTLLLLIIPGLMYGRILMDLVRKVRDEYDRAGAIVEQAVSAVRTVYSFVGEGRTMGRFSDALQGPMKLGIKQGLAKGIAIGSNSVTFSIWALMTWYGSKLVMYHGGSGGTIFAAGACIIMGGLSLGSGLSNVKYLSEAASAGERVAQVMNRVPKIDSDDTSGEVLANVVGDVHFKSVEFAYPARPELPILRSFTLHVPAGRTMALVGSSGSGKSTTVALLQRFYDPRRGEVVLDGVDIRKLRLKWLRSQMGLVSQEPALFATTIKENILFGKEDATMEEVVAAAIASNAHKFISQLPQGYDTQVGERGVQMSGGQKQRIAIARAIIRSPKILLLDEATSALDTESERVVQEALDKAAVGRTTIIIAHRLSTIRNADAIAVIQAGKVVELGSHRHLISDREGAYSTLVRLQEQSADAQTSAPKQQHPSMISHGERSSHSLSRRVSSSGGAGLVSRTGSANSFHFMGLQHDIDLEIETEMETELDGATTKEALKSEKKGKSVPSFRRLISMNYPEWKQGIVGLISATLFGAIQPVYALALGSMISVFFLGDHNEIKSQIRTYALVFLALAIFSFTINVGQHYNFGVMGERLTRRVREQMLSKILTFEVAWFDEEGNSTGSICSRLAKDATVVRSLIGDRMALLIQATSAVTVACVMGLVIAWRLALVMIAVQPVIILCFYTRKVLLRSMSGKAIRGQAESCKLAGDAVSNVRTITAFSSQDRILGLFEQSQEGPRRSNVGQAWFAGLVLGAAQGLTHCTWALDFWYGGKLINQGFLNAKQVFQTFMILVSTGRVIAEAGSMATDLAKGADAVASVFQVLDRFTKIEPEDPEGVQPDRSRILGEIEFKDVNFAYPARPEVTIFSGFSLFIESGRSTALVGESGSGKSTIIALAERFYDPLKGSVLIDGRDIRMYHLRALRRHIALVSQEPTLFSGTIRDNIAYGLAAAFDDGDNKDIATAPSQGEIEDAARAANAHDFISSLKDGYDTLCGDKGMQLSGGQKQRIAIARAIIKNPAVLLLDEATSALDSQSESVVQEALDRVMVGRTSVVVAHRLSTVRNCDTIVVLSKGTVIEKGSHSSLLAKGPAGAYYSLVALQQEKKNTQL